MVTAVLERFIGYYGAPNYYLFRNLGPAKITLTFHGSVTSGNPHSHDLRKGEEMEWYCALAEAVRSVGEEDNAILQWARID
jgi:hypothetical protein